MSDLRTIGSGALAAQPFSRLMGAELVELVAGRAELRLAVRADFAQQHGFIHGGVLSYLADNALTFAGGSVLGPDVVTAEYLTSYARPAKGTLLVARAVVVSASRRQALCRCDVFVMAAEQEMLCAIAQGTIVRLGGSAEEGTAEPSDATGRDTAALRK